MSRIDYCNSLLLGAAKYNLDKLQQLQNMACRVIHRRRKYDSIPYQIMELHWLKVNERVVFKVATLMYKCMDGIAPEYLVQLVCKEHHHTLWSTNERKLPVSINRLSQVHNSLFSAMGPRVWNSLPTKLRQIDSLDTFNSFITVVDPSVHADGFPYICWYCSTCFFSHFFPVSEVYKYFF